MQLGNPLSDSLQFERHEFNNRRCSCSSCRLNTVNGQQVNNSQGGVSAANSSGTIDLTGDLTDEYYAQYRGYFASAERIGYYVHDTTEWIDFDNGTWGASWDHYSGHEIIIDKAFSDIDPYIDLDFYKTEAAADAQIHIYRVSGIEPPTILGGDYDLGIALGSNVFSFLPSSGTPGKFQTAAWKDYPGYREDGNPFLIDENGYDYGIAKWQDAATIIHEIGHTLGLSHPQSNGNDDPNGSGHNTSTTIMSYNPDVKYDEYGISAHAPSWSSADFATLQSIWGSENGNNDHPTNSSDTITITSSTHSLFLFNGNDKAYGGAEEDVIYGNQGLDTIKGGLGDDIVYGGKDNDLLCGNQGEDRIYGNLGDDLIYGGKSNDWQHGGMGADVLYGNLGDDLIYGGKSNDTLHGGQGADVLYGNSGADLFKLSAGSDRVMDFNSSEGDSIAIRSGLAYSIQSQGSDMLINTDIGSLRLVGTDLNSFNSAQSIVAT